MIPLVAFLRVVARVPRPIWYFLAGLTVFFGVWRWHKAEINAAHGAGAAAQHEIDRAAFVKASLAAETAQLALKSALAVRQEKVTKGTQDALSAKNADLVRRYDDLRLRWAAYRTGESGTREGGAIGVSPASERFDDAACPAAGWVSFDTAAAAAEAADVAIARDDAWREWVAAQMAAWPQDR